MKKKTGNIIARKITDLAYDTAKNTVGKCIPLVAHEVKMPECIKKELSEKQ